MERFDQVYYVESQDDPAVNPIAIRPTLYESRIEWMDTSKGKVLTGARSEAEPDRIEIFAKNGYRYTLRKLTLSLYNKHVKPKVMLPPTFTSDQEVQDFYLHKDFEIM